MNPTAANPAERPTRIRHWILLFLFLIPVTLTFHSWWTYAAPEQQQVNMLFFMHNLTLMGGLLLVMTVGPGPLSIDLKGKRPL